MNAFVHDLAAQDSGAALQARLADVAWPPVTTLSLIFVLSAIPPQRHVDVLQTLVQAVPVGASVVFRDYARLDLAQLRFHTRKDAAWAEPSMLSETHDWYRRGDSTMAYFFTCDEVSRLAEAAGLQGAAEEVVKTSTNRRTGAVMVRRFIQARWRRIA